MGACPQKVWLGVAVTITNHGLDPVPLAQDSGIESSITMVASHKVQAQAPTLLHIDATFGPPHFIPRYHTNSPNTVPLRLGFEVCTTTPGLWHMIEICRRKLVAETGKCECFGQKKDYLEEERVLYCKTIKRKELWTSKGIASVVIMKCFVECILEKNKRTTLWIPTWSPTVVLTQPEHA